MQQSRPVDARLTRILSPLLHCASLTRVWAQADFGGGVHVIIVTVVQASFFALEFRPKLSQMLVSRASAARLALALALLQAAACSQHGGSIDNSNFCEDAADLQEDMPMPYLTLGGEENFRIRGRDWNDCAAASDDLLSNGLRATSWNDVTCEQISNTTLEGRPVRAMIPPSCCGGQATFTAAAPAGGKIVAPTAKRPGDHCDDHEMFSFPLKACVTRCGFRDEDEYRHNTQYRLISAPPSIATGVSMPTVTPAVSSSDATITDCPRTGDGSEDDCGCDRPFRPKWFGVGYKCVKCAEGYTSGRVGPNHTMVWKCFPSVRSNQTNTKLITKWSVIQCESSNGQLTDAVAREAVSRKPTITDCPNHLYPFFSYGLDLHDLSRQCGCSDDQHVGMAFWTGMTQKYPKCFKCPNDAPHFFYSDSDTVETPQCYMNCPPGKEYFCAQTMSQSRCRLVYS